MKRLWISLGILLVAVVVMAQTSVLVRPHNTMMISTVAVTGDVTGALMDPYFYGGVLYAVDMKCTDDDAIGVKFYSHKGSELADVTIAKAIAGDMSLITAQVPVNGQMSYDISGYADSVACSMEVTLKVK
jgi:hypothetical protein